MRKTVLAFCTLSGMIVVVILTFIVYLYLTNRTVDQKVALNFTVTSDWTEISADPPLGAFRHVQELVISIPGYRMDRNERLTTGQIRLPDGRIATPEVQAFDNSGNWVTLEFSGHTLSQRDFVIYRMKYDLNGNVLTKIRIRSIESFDCEEIFWRNRNPK